jgi:hypothetical protein
MGARLRVSLKKLGRSEIVPVIDHRLCPRAMPTSAGSRPENAPMAAAGALHYCTPTEAEGSICVRREYGQRFSLQLSAGHLRAANDKTTDCRAPHTMDNERDLQLQRGPA